MMSCRLKQPVHNSLSQPAAFKTFRINHIHGQGIHLSENFKKILCNTLFMYPCPDGKYTAAGVGSLCFICRNHGCLQPLILGLIRKRINTPGDILRRTLHNSQISLWSIVLILHPRCFWMKILITVFSQYGLIHGHAVQNLLKHFFCNISRS